MVVTRREIIAITGGAHARNLVIGSVDTAITDASRGGRHRLRLAPGSGAPARTHTHTGKVTNQNWRDSGKETGREDEADGKESPGWFNWIQGSGVTSSIELLAR